MTWNLYQIYLCITIALFIIFIVPFLSVLAVNETVLLESSKLLLIYEILECPNFFLSRTRDRVIILEFRNNWNLVKLLNIVDLIVKIQIEAQARIHPR